MITTGKNRKGPVIFHHLKRKPQGREVCNKLSLKIIDQVNNRENPSLNKQIKLIRLNLIWFNHSL